ncbi:betA [Symbiodinium necroappetens]|uniref:BetA protein n=1 Tax=Symbiodinium necroappetens TaxID=1628268 RepID=A0A812LRM2_9DINO|nr:betA [Symbiodinium necroappetens]
MHRRPEEATPLASELREPPPADSPLRPVRAQSFEKDGDDAQAELALFQHPVITISSTAFMGSVTLIVPPGVAVEQDGSAIFGGFGDAGGIWSSSQSSGMAGRAPVTLRVVGTAMMGRVNVVVNPRAPPAQLLSQEEVARILREVPAAPSTTVSDLLDEAFKAHGSGGSYPQQYPQPDPRQALLQGLAANAAAAAAASHNHNSVPGVPVPGNGVPASPAPVVTGVPVQSDAPLNFSPQTEDTEDQSKPWLLSDEVQDRQAPRGKQDVKGKTTTKSEQKLRSRALSREVAAARNVRSAAVGVCLSPIFGNPHLGLWQGSSSPTNAKEEWWQQQLLAQQRESEERTRTLRESTLASLQSPSSQEAKEVVVVGGGSAGAHLAYRLSEDPKRQVLLLEAGRPDNSPFLHVPVFYFKAIGSSFDWRYRTDGETSGLNGRSLAWPRGKVLGGSSALNGLLYIRGLKHDYDAWAAAGNQGWSYEELLPHFRRCEDAPFDHPDRGTGGPMSVCEGSYRTDLAERWSEACAEVCGVPRVRDMSLVAADAASQGAGVAYFSNFKTPGGFRCSSALPLHEVRHQRSNLHILCNAEAEKLILDGCRVVGIQASCGSQEHMINAGEVALCAGALGSPQLLLKSGIGAPSSLAKANVTCVHALPGVGENLQDHLQLRPKFRVQAATLNSQVGELAKFVTEGGLLGWTRAALSSAAWRYAFEFLKDRTGPVSMAASQVCAFVPSVRNSSSPPDLQFHFQHAGCASGCTPKQAEKQKSAKANTVSLNLIFSGCRSNIEPGLVFLDTFDAFTASVCILRPESRGRVELLPDGRLRISPHYLSTPGDASLAVKSLELAREVARHPLLREVAAQVEMPESLDANYAREIAETIYHPAGTCKMGPDSDEMAVVDPMLRVSSEFKLADAALLRCCFPGCLEVMIAEKAAVAML